MPHVLPLRLQQRRPGRIRPRLDAVQRALAALGSPQREFPSLLVVGTNGKGSTAAMLASVLEAHGLRVGLYTSPHLVRVEERIRVGGAPVSGQRLDEQLRRLDEHPELTFFETLTVAALATFARRRVDCAVLEAGMGGRWDATRAAEADVVGLTNVGTDHRRWLGEERADIGRDKGAALAAAAVAVLGPGVDAEIRPHLGAPSAVAAAELIQLVDGDREDTLTAAWGDARTDLRLPLAGRHQRDNLQLALAMALGAVQAGLLGGLDPGAVSRGVAAVRWPGRLSRHTVGERSVLLDAAHNLEGVAALTRHLEGLPERPNLLFSCLDDKPLPAMAALLRPQVGAVAVFPLDDERAMPTEALARAFPEANVAQDAVTGLALLPDPVLACGSLRVVGTLLAASEEGPPW